MARVGVDGRWLRVHVAICDIDQAWTLAQAIAEADRPIYDAKRRLHSAPARSAARSS